MTLSVFAQFSIFGHIALPGLNEAERLETKARLQRLESAVNASRRDLVSYAHDWAAWGETSQYLAVLGSDYPFADLVTGTLLAEDIDLFGLYDVKGRLVWGALPEARIGGLPIDPEKLEEYLATHMPMMRKVGYLGISLLIKTSPSIDLGPRKAMYGPHE